MEQETLKQNDSQTDSQTDSQNTSNIQIVEQSSNTTPNYVDGALVPPTYLVLYLDIVRLLASYLEPCDLLPYSQVSKLFYRAMRTEPYKSLISYPYINNYKITKEQSDCLRIMSQPNQTSKFKLVHGEVGSGKTWVALSYTFLKYKSRLSKWQTKNQQTPIKQPQIKQPTKHAMGLEEIKNAITRKNKRAEKAKESEIKANKYRNQVKIVIIVPPSLVAQWSDFIQKHTNLRVLSNYKSSCFYKGYWRQIWFDYSIFISSNILAKEIVHQFQHPESPNYVKHVIIHDEAHNGISNAGYYAEEVIGFTASIKSFKDRATFTRYNNTDPSNSIEIYELKAAQLTKNLLPINYVEYDYCGYNEEQANIINTSLRARHINSFYISEIRNMAKILTYGTCPEYSFEIVESVANGFKGGHGKLYSYRCQDPMIANSANCYNEVDVKVMLAMVKNVPKLKRIGEICLEVKARNEKIVLFDTNIDYLVIVWVYLSKLGLSSMLFSSTHSAADRPKLIEKFKTSGDVLLGSIKMLSEGHNITEANNILFLRYPNSKDEFEQALGRCHRYPQPKTVNVHMLFSCKLEENIARNDISSNDNAYNLRQIFFNNDNTICIQL